MDTGDVGRALARCGIHPDAEDLAAVRAIATHQLAIVDGLRSIAGGTGAIGLVPDLGDSPRGGPTRGGAIPQAGSVLSVDEAAANADRLDAALGAFSARFDVAACRTDAPDPTVPLRGLPVAVKDLVHTRESPTLGGSRGYRPPAPQAEGRAVRRLRDAGAVIVGKTTTMELGIGIPTEGTSLVVPRNPWDPRRWPGGSSSGSAIAVATGMAALAIGTDTGGSIRCPAALCGVTGFKPTHGVVPAEGMIVGGATHEVIGPMARTAAECATAFEVMAALPATEPERVPVRTLTVGVVAGLPGVDPVVAQRLEEAVEVFAEIGTRVVRLRLPEWADLAALAMVGTVAEHFASMADQLAGSWALFLDDTRRVLASGAVLSARDYLVVQSARRALRSHLIESMGDVDFLLLPTAPREAPLLSELGGIAEFVGFTSPVNALGWPAATVPMGFGGEGLPVGLQIVGRAHADRGVLALAEEYQRRTDWHARTPAVAQ